MASTLPRHTAEWKMSDELKVPKRRVQVELLVPGSPARQVTVFLSEFASTHTGPERLSDLLNGHDEFLPGLDLAADAITFFGRHSIAAARVAREWELGEEPVAGQQHEVEIQLTDGALLRGTVTFVLPHERARLLDYLNDAQPFVRLTEKETVALINKRHIVRVAKAKEQAKW
jgi:hypothetical protein